MLEYSLTFLIVLGAYLIYTRYILPKKAIAHYAKMFRSRGYRVFETHFNPISAPYFDSIFQSVAANGDPFFHHKNRFAQVDVMISNVLDQPDIIFMNPELIKEASNMVNMTALEKDYTFSEVFYSWIRRGIVCQEKDEWKHRKKQLSKVFNFEFVTSHVPHMITIANDVFGEFQQKQKKAEAEGKEGINFQQMMLKFTSEVITSGFLGLDSLKVDVKTESVTEKVLRVSHLSVHSFKDPLVLMFGEKLVSKGWRKYDRQQKKAKQDLNFTLKRCIDKQQQKYYESKKNGNDGGHKNIIWLIIEERQKGRANGERCFIDNDDIVDELKGFISAGAESTSNLLIALIFYVFENEQVAKRLREQINAVIKQDGDITVENMKKISFLDCIILETERIFSSAPFNFQRKATKDITVGGVTLAKGTLVDRSWINFLHNPQLFENPHEFIPQRWEKEENKKYEHLVSIEFGSGPRACIGKSLALTQIKVMTIMIFQRYENIRELGMKERAYELPFTIAIKNTNAILVKKEAND